MRITEPLLFLLGPLFYFLIKSVLSPQFRLSTKHLIHLVPFLLSLAYVIPWILQPAESKVQGFEQYLNGENMGVSLSGFLNAFLHISQTLTYAYFSFKAIRAQYNGAQNLQTALSRKLRFLHRFSKVFTSYWILQVLGLITIASLQYYVFYIDYALALINSVFIQTLCFQFLLHPNYLSEFQLTKKYEHSSLNRTDFHALVQRIQDLIHEEEVYLESNLTLQQFSERLSVNRNYVSQVINETFGCGFNDYINEYRVTRAKELLTDPEYDRLKLLAIALESGFNNKTSFNRVFTRKTGQSPSEYRKLTLISRQESGNN